MKRERSLCPRVERQLIKCRIKDALFKLHIWEKTAVRVNRMRKHSQDTIKKEQSSAPNSQRKKVQLCCKTVSGERRGRLSQVYLWPNSSQLVRWVRKRGTHVFLHRMANQSTKKQNQWLKNKKTTKQLKPGSSNRFRSRQVKKFNLLIKMYKLYALAWQLVRKKV